MSAVGFEPTRIAPPELESGALDRSAKLTYTFARFENPTQSFTTWKNYKIYKRNPKVSCVKAPDTRNLTRDHSMSARSTVERSTN